MIVLNFDWFSRADDGRVAALLECADRVDLVVIDEVQFLKNPEAKRSKHVHVLLATLRERNANLRLLIMSATPIANTPKEGWDLLRQFVDPDLGEPSMAPLAERAALHQHFVSIPSVRHRIDLGVMMTETRREVAVAVADCEDLVAQFRARHGDATPLEVELFLTHHRLPTIVEEVKKSFAKGDKVLVFTNYIGGNPDSELPGDGIPSKRRRIGDEVRACPFFGSAASLLLVIDYCGVHVPST